MKKLTYIQGYKSMFFFLRGYFKKTRVGDVASLLSDTMFCEEDGEMELSTSDPASWYDWVDSIYKTFPLLKRASEKELTYFQAFRVMYTFLYNYEKATSYEDVADILKELTPIAAGNENGAHDPNIWNRWLDSIQKAINAKSSAD